MVFTPLSKARDSAADVASLLTLDKGYGSQSNGRGRANAAREVLWFSPHCLRPDRRILTLFDMA